MLFRTQELERIVSGEITLAFRRWTRPTVRAGGVLRTQRGVLAIEAMERVRRSAIRTTDAARAGYATRAQLLAELDRKDGGELYRIALRYAGADERIALRAKAATGGERERLEARLRAMDERARNGPWTARLLALIAARPGVRAGDLAPVFGEETRAFKARVRRLKELGLSESLEVGYRLSPRARDLVRRRKA